jgi:hypothetical protein
VPSVLQPGHRRHPSGRIGHVEDQQIVLGRGAAGFVPSPSGEL